ncbi:hypothetical protein E2562_034709 [Oryza meyeriana var. granulata]|uniref:Uncharacterized protein n=1 Tax=Oryza meyeriana var. granulata TaxID=110450 RepID=A0A6G1CAQ4_9ORYZ|nr:hypothetical protein E2562_034709 [Oryza meyeriana var. granulata]
MGKAEEEQVPHLTLVPVEKQPQKVAIDLINAIREIKTSANEKKRNFTETVEAHVMLGVDPRRGYQPTFIVAFTSTYALH